MKILEDIIEKYRILFDKTGKIEFFMHAKNVERLNNDIMGVEKIDEVSEEQTLLP